MTARLRVSRIATVLYAQQCRGKLSTIASRIRIADLLAYRADNSGPSVTVAGLIRTIRKQKRVAFAALQDGSSVNAAQLILTPEQAASLSSGTAVAVQGKWLPSKGGAGQEFELHVDEIIPQGGHDALGYPIQKKYHTAEFLRTLPHLRIRTAQNALLLRLRSQVIANVTEFFNRRGFIQTHTPIITSSDCEGAGEVFTVDTKQARSVAGAQQGPPQDDIGHFFGTPRYLTVSSQLHLEALAASVGDVWTLSPTFRAEKSDTSRHLTEFYMLEAELAFTNELESIMVIVEDLIRSLTKSLKNSRPGQELLAMQRVVDTSRSEDTTSDPDAVDLLTRWDGLLKNRWPRTTFHEACSTLRALHHEGKANFVVLPDETHGLQTEHERYLADILYNGPVFVTDYPKAIKPFYMLPSTPGAIDLGPVPTVSCFDLLLPEVCEVAGGSMREHRLDCLSQQMRDGGLLRSNALQDGDAAPSSGGNQEPSALDWYLDLRRYGSMPHGGFGLGFDRLLGFLAGIRNVRDVVTFPRHYKRALC